MRAVFPLLAACAALAACSTGSRQVNTAPPSVSYQVTGNGLARTNAEAQNYCAQYGHAAQYRGVQPSSSGNVAVYTCDGAATGGSVTATPPPPQGSSAPPAATSATPGAPTPLTRPVQCADALHQDRPGGTDYHGPPVAGCPQQ